ncbi:MAG TPA: pantetheine-phosphate adenylyltransferase [Candidatus Krumholzibacteria bacterium]|nr:pantetheine-phosphate adenylyltransferase [Candidatus Krumholzibacteria bacterium]HPD71471.1 pantetheine-phosphate adenylyltransferase [Candidatus Krumholzibacteria bacterium]HRY41596.1 pantetheine-phosphate adenylyltransferase [Candidatus Krumholzibacteria bacterium]
MPERLALYPGSFDPVTLGHLDILRRARGLFDRVVVLVAADGKAGLWTVERRAQLVRESLALDGALAGCPVETFTGLLVDEARRRGACAVVRGMRSAADYEHEWSLHGVNRTLWPPFETIWLPARPELAAISSSLVRQVARHGGSLTGLVPAPVAAALAADPPR